MESTMAKNGMRPIHPGEILREEYLAPLHMSVNALAGRLRVPTTRMNEIVRERRGITPDTALRLARFFGGDAESWLNLQQAFDLKTVELVAAEQIDKEVEPMQMMA
jgi:addiction module HigA family antidote